MRAKPSEKDLKNVVEGMLSSYEMRIQSIGAIFDTTHNLLQSFQESFLDTRLERERINEQLRENLAHSESLRKRDFDNMMHEILAVQDRREGQVRDLLNGYLDSQQEMASSLRSNLAQIKEALAEGQAKRVREFQTTIKEVLAEQEERKQQVVLRLNEFQESQHVMAVRLKELLAKGSELRVKDLKRMLVEFAAQRKVRTGRRIERKKEVRNMLGGFRDQRLENAEGWQAMEEKRAQRKADSHTAVTVGA